MKIGIMLRHMSQHGGGVMVYTNNLLREILSIDSPHEFILLYNDSKFVETYSTMGRVREVSIGKAPSIMWDQINVRRAEKREKLDLIFNPKYSLPLRAKGRTVFVSHGLDWYVMPWGSRWIDRLSHKYLVPRYAKKADSIIAVSETTRQHVVEYLNVDPDRVQTIYLGVDEAFREPITRDKLDEVRRKYRLPEKYFLYVGQIYPPKNFGRLIQAYAKVGPELGIHLVVAGTHTWLCEDEIALIDKLGISDWVIRPGWIDRITLPSFYRMAEALLLPSLYESCGIPILEGMASGCPVVTSDRYGTAELAADAAILVNPDEIESIADGMRRSVTDETLRQQCIEAGRNRAAEFHWKKCATETLDILEKTVQA
jgi:glycosyltransferase involved in cell wall biosynthesis